MTHGHGTDTLFPMIRITASKEPSKFAHGLWLFSDIDGWEFKITGYYGECCCVAKSEYSRLQNTKFGMLNSYKI